jgi:glycine cleavage system transcriptional repressor
MEEPEMGRCTISVFGRDRPGIVAAVTSELADAGCNLEDSSMTILRGHFAMMLVVLARPDIDAEALAMRLERVRLLLDLDVSVRPIHDEVTGTAPLGEPYAIAVYGADRPGLVARVSAALAARDVNIVDLETRVVGEPEPVYVMHFEVEVPPGRAEEVEADLRAVGADLGVETSMRPDEPDVL